METENRGRVLVVDDVPAIRELLREHLREIGFSVEGAGDGNEALQKARISIPNVILLDVDMPVMDGYETLSAIRGEDDLCSIPVIVCSSEEDMDRVQECLDSGADDYVFKPFNGPMLLARIDNLLGKL